MFLFKKKNKPVLHNKPTVNKWDLPSIDILPKVSNNCWDEMELDTLQVKAIIDLITPCRIVKTVYTSRTATVHIDLINVLDFSKIKRNAVNLQAAFHCNIQIVASTIAHFAIVFPMESPKTVYFRDCMQALPDTGMYALIGRNDENKPCFIDISKAPHVLIAGQTGSGKSVLENDLIASLLLAYTPQEMQLLMIDPKCTELTQYNGIPHLIHEVITDAQNAAVALTYINAVMEERYREMQKKGLRDCTDVYSRIVIVIDELAQLMLSPCKKAIETSITKIAQLGRACGIHLILATQRPTVNVITGLIKANVPTRICLSVASVRDSMTVIDHKGGETLSGNGDGLLKRNGTIKEERIQAAYIDSKTIDCIVNYWKRA